MRSLYWRFFLFLVLFGQAGISQKLKKSDQLTLTNLQNHIHFLADDKLEGRRAGTKGEALAMDYISDQFRQIGLGPKGTEGYYQNFDINEGKDGLCRTFERPQSADPLEMYLQGRRYAREAQQLLVSALAVDVEEQRPRGVGEVALIGDARPRPRQESAAGARGG